LILLLLFAGALKDMLGAKSKFRVYADDVPIHEAINGII